MSTANLPGTHLTTIHRSESSDSLVSRPFRNTPRVIHVYERLLPLIIRVKTLELLTHLRQIQAANVSMCSAMLLYISTQDAFEICIINQRVTSKFCDM
jgi:hypothetical protein